MSHRQYVTNSASENVDNAEQRFPNWEAPSPGGPEDESGGTTLNNVVKRNLYFCPNFRSTVVITATHEPSDTLTDLSLRPRSVRRAQTQREWLA
ncbi:hypothetical protein M8J77_003687 [Diaphorina citri]|nr:hypothetical protein M8J77_003687 [Diaphorina citri]